MLLSKVMQETAVNGSGSMVGVCLNREHPVLTGRCLVHWRDADGGHEEWLPCLNGLKPEVHDHLLLLKPENAGESIVIGVVDGLKKKTEREPAPGPSVQLKEKEALHILAADGSPLLEVRQGEQGPVVRLLNQDLEIETAGDLRLNARSISLKARQGEIQMEATDDVVVKGEIIRLN